MYYIYKITNKEDGKIYIGQTSKTVQERWKRHCYDALSGRLTTHLSNAIRKYGVSCFDVCCIEEVREQKTASEREFYWITYYDSIDNGYNEMYSPLKSGENTYAGRSLEEMAITKAKLSVSKMGGKNPMSKSIKCKSQVTGQELFFESVADCQRYFGQSNHTFISARLCGRIGCLWYKEWSFAYTDEEYKDFSIEKGNWKRKK